MFRLTNIDVHISRKVGGKRIGRAHQAAGAGRSILRGHPPDHRTMHLALQRLFPRHLIFLLLPVRPFCKNRTNDLPWKLQPRLVTRRERLQSRRHKRLVYIAYIGVPAGMTAATRQRQAEIDLTSGSFGSHASRQPGLSVARGLVLGSHTSGA
ncbi:hypothetical protein IF2G_00331 [Cordyceps javanica]|nr:hypothetical protein IF2G_00331 [Cordyceps javanica]